MPLIHKVTTVQESQIPITPHCPLLSPAAIPDALSVYFTGAGGNVGAGKYNDGAHENRGILAGRLADGMKRAWEGTKSHLWMFQPFSGLMSLFHCHLILLRLENIVERSKSGKR